MTRFNPALGVGLAALALASCSKSRVETLPTAEQLPPAEAVAAADAGEDFVVTGSRIPRPNLESSVPITVLDSHSYAAPAGEAPRAVAPAPAPAPSPVIVSGQRMARPDAHAWQRPYNPPEIGRDRFTGTSENPFKVAAEEPVSTFSIDVDTASYSWVRASLTQNVLPQPAAVRTEEMINYFPYDYAAPQSAAQPFNSHISVFPSPWAPGRKLVRIGIKGFDVRRARRPRANLVFLVDTSGSMHQANGCRWSSSRWPCCSTSSRPTTGSPSSPMPGPPGPRSSRLRRATKRPSSG